jgi:ATP-binding cassette subfamily F protein uup
MDKLVDHYFVFEGDGVIDDHHGTYEEYRVLKEEREAEDKRLAREASGGSKSTSKKKPPPKKKSQGLTFKEQKLFKKLEKKIASLEKEQEKLKKDLAGGELSGDDLREASERYGTLKEEIEENTLEWMELAEKDEEAKM